MMNQKQRDIIRNFLYELDKIHDKLSKSGMTYDEIVNQIILNCLDNFSLNSVKKAMSKFKEFNYNSRKLYRYRNVEEIRKAINDSYGSNEMYLSSSEKALWNLIKIPLDDNFLWAIYSSNERITKMLDKILKDMQEK